MQRLTPRISAIAAATGDFSNPVFSFPRLAQALRFGLPAAFAAIPKVVRGWCERERDRRELAAMSPRDFGDLNVAFSAVRDEVSRWPWQRPVLVERPEQPPEAEIDPIQCLVIPFAAFPVERGAAPTQRRFSDAA
jgi:uncharacterized protein YjiS (DUF1127 family)